MNDADKLIERLRVILSGIDRTELDFGSSGVDGWWETSTGAAFGAAKLIEIEVAVFEAIKR